ncbi:MAG: EVE domain-containing protein [Bryobacterales bacterium]|nr:EVE domain-containing protein [Bryobacteraceae bacterium]MDW8353839.1 EVE domain-containing protein [Bryobacterales bacterium]
MKYFLAKTDPGTYSLDDLERDKQTVWDGVSNPQALRAIRQMRPGDKVFIYHSGGQSAVVGLAEVVSEPRPDPNNPKLSVADFRFLARLVPPTTLAEVKAQRSLQSWALVRQPRLSTMEAPAAFVEWMRRRYPKAPI